MKENKITDKIQEYLKLQTEILDYFGEISPKYANHIATCEHYLKYHANISLKRAELFKKDWRIKFNEYTDAPQLCIFETWYGGGYEEHKITISYEHLEDFESWKKEIDKQNRLAEKSIKESIEKQKQEEKTRLLKKLQDLENK